MASIIGTSFIGRIPFLMDALSSMASILASESPMLGYAPRHFSPDFLLCEYLKIQYLRPPCFTYRCSPVVVSKCLPGDRSLDMNACVNDFFMLYPNLFHDFYPEGIRNAWVRIKLLWNFSRKLTALAL